MWLRYSNNLKLPWCSPGLARSDLLYSTAVIPSDLPATLTPPQPQGRSLSLPQFWVRSPDRPLALHSVGKSLQPHGNHVLSVSLPWKRGSSLTSVSLVPSPRTSRAMHCHLKSGFGPCQAIIAHGQHETVVLSSVPR